MTPTANAGAAALQTQSDEASTLRQIRRRVVFSLFIIFILNAVDRANVSFAALQMNADLGLSPKDYGMGAGMTFLALVAFQIPSMAVLKRMRWQLWLSVTVVCWGAACVAMAWISNAFEFFALRFSLGVFEAGFSPGLIYILAQWLPQRLRGGALGAVIMAVPISLMLSGPLCGWLMAHGNLVGMAGWRFLFLVNGLVTVAAGVAVYLYAGGKPTDARWLSPTQRTWITEELAKDSAGPADKPVRDFRSALTSRIVWTNAALWCTLQSGMVGLVFWLPQIVKSLEQAQSDMRVAWLSSLPWIAAATGTYVNGRLSDKTGRRRLHVGVGIVLGAIGLLLGWTSSDPTLAMAGLVLAGLGLGSTHGVFWTIPLAYMPAKSSGAGILVINMSGTITGFVISRQIGSVLEATGSFHAAGYLLAGLLTFGLLLLLSLPKAPHSTIPRGASAAH